MAQGGWTGKVLRVDLSNVQIGLEVDTTKQLTAFDVPYKGISKVDTMKYKDYIGGLGLGLKVLWDETTATTRAFDPENRLIFGVGPLTGTGTPLSARVTIIALWPPHLNDNLAASGHMGGHWGPELKYAGWDSVIVQGKASKPVWIQIIDDKVTVMDAGNMWGNGIFRATSDIMDIMGPSAHVAAIGQAGENLSPLACVMTGRSHSAGGVGGVMGSKNLKAIGVLGNGPVKIATDKVSWKKLVKYQHTNLGANSGGVIPATFQSWQPDGLFGGTRWTAAKGRYWGAANPPVDTGDCTSTDMNSIGLRTHKGFADHGGYGIGDKHTVKIGGCHGCPIRCHIYTDCPQLEQYGVSRYQVNTCSGNSTLSSHLTKAPTPSIFGSQLSVAIGDDYGNWRDYGLAAGTFLFMYRTKAYPDAAHPEWTPATIKNAAGVDIPNPVIGMSLWDKYLSAAERTRLNTAIAGTIPAPWKLLNPDHITNYPYDPAKTAAQNQPPAQTKDSDLRFIPWLGADWAANKMVDGTIATWEKIKAGGTQSATLGALIGMGAGRLATLVPELEYELKNNKNNTNALTTSFIKHHSTEQEGAGYVAALINMLFNRDPQCHTHSNFLGNGLSVEKQNEIFAKLFADDGLNGPTVDKSFLAADTPPMNKSKAVFAKLSIIYMELHNSLTICNYTLPGWASPLNLARDKNPNGDYVGDADLDTKYYNAVTGENLTRKQFEDIGIRIMCLTRALNARAMNTKQQRTLHDKAAVPSWYFATGGVWKSGICQIDPAQMEIAIDMLYAEFGWDKATGMPTRATFERLGMKAIADDLAAKGLLP
jgi:aldehyde:ferredoxin oxidoreductase